MSTIPFQYNDGGRKKAGFKGNTRDCVTRAISIALGRPYEAVYKGLNVWNGLSEAPLGGRDNTSSRTGLYQNVCESFLGLVNWKYTKLETSKGKETRLTPWFCSAMRERIIIVRVHRHLCCISDGVLNDTHRKMSEYKVIEGFWEKYV